MERPFWRARQAPVADGEAVPRGLEAGDRHRTSGPWDSGTRNSETWDSGRWTAGSWRPTDPETDSPSQLAQLEQDAFARLLPTLEGQRVLALGCGDGRGARLLLERGASQVVAVESELRALVRPAVFRHSALHRVVAQALRLPASEAEFDGVVVRRRFSTLPDLDAALEEIAAVLRPGGQLVVTDTHPFALLAEAAGRETRNHAHLVADFLDSFERWGLTLEALEEPRWSGLPRIIALRARRRSETRRTPRDPRDAAQSRALGRPLVAIRRPPPQGWRRLAAGLGQHAEDRCEGLWRSLFRRFATRRPNVERLSPSGGRTVWVLTAQPGDEMAGCAATLLAHRRAGDRVRVVHATDGRHGARILGLRRDELAALRRHEAEEVASHLDLEIDWLDLEPRDGFERLVGQVVRRLDDETPEILYVPSRVTQRDDAGTLARAVAAALGDPEAAPEELRIYPLDVPLGPALWTAALPTDRAELSTLVTASYVSRLELDRPALRRRRYDALLLGLPGLVETYLQLDSATYRRWHRPQGPVSPYRSLRPAPWTDPLAYLWGRRERQRLRRLSLA